MRKIFLILLLAWPLAGQADERILSFDSEIVVHADGSQTVTETIRVRAEGKKIKRGIYRDFPTTYKGHGRQYKVDFQVVEVLRDGGKEGWHTQRLSNGIRVYMGRKNVLLEPGDYSYRLTYITDRQLGFFDEHDELYWNVTGNGWDFAIDRVSASLFLPPAVPLTQVRPMGYTGKQGSRGQDYRAGRTDAAMVYETLRPLGPREGLTIVASWPKGFIREPAWQDELAWRWRDEPGIFIVWGGALLLLFYYWLAWLRVGRDPAAGVIVPEYEPPEGYSPAAVRLIYRMGYDNKIASAALVGLAVKGAVTLEENDSVYTVKPTGESQAALGEDEATLLAGIGALGMTFSKSRHERIRQLLKSHREKLDDMYRKRYYYANRGWVIPGWVLSVLVLAVAGWQSINSYGPEALFFLFMAAFCIGFTSPFLVQLWRMRHRYHRGVGDWLRLVMTATPAFFLIGMLNVSDLAGFLGVVPWQLLAGMIAIILINLLYHYLIKAPTLRGRRLLDRIEGFKRYLTLAEGDELKLRYASAVTPEKFEACLPYAIALDVETEWADRFAADLREAGKDPSNYRSRWYSGSDFRGVRGLSSSVGSALASSVASASTPPGSSSGGGGGGFSGGGGGGGGGGGW